MITQKPEEVVEDTANFHDSSSIQSRSSFSSSSSHSYTSTIGYSQESWDDFRPRVEKLCEVLWPPPKSIGQFLATCMRKHRMFRSFVPPVEAPLIERLREGDYNRITGITLPSSYGKEAQKLILRTSRWNEGRPDRELAILSYVRQRTAIPVPEIVARDLSCNNALGKPYAIQRWVPGSDLSSIWDKISHRQRCTIACEIGRVLKILLSLESLVPGLIEAAPTDTAFTPDPKIVPFELKEPDGELIEEPVQEATSNVEAPRAPETTGDFFKFQFRRWQAYALTRPFERDIALFNSLLEAVCEMDDMGLFRDDGHCLCHVDLDSRNIMAEVQPDGSIKVRAVLDWDEAVIAPKFVNCQPPWWLWEEDGDERVDEQGLPTWPYELEAASSFPGTPEKQELKRLFEQHAGPEYRQLAYDEHSRLSRGLFILATQGLPASEHYKAAERILREWKAFRQSLAK
ncbi:hypothetical protein MMC28_003765 [Mycoblastus sanguinarius]|nr:hypothetical protein [Mycoblastus sanguinarius]